MPLTGFCKWVFLIYFSPLLLVHNPPMSQCFFFSLCSLGFFPSLRFISTLPLPLFLPLLLHVSLVYLCSPLNGLRKAQFFWPLVPCPASSLSTGTNKSDDQSCLPYCTHNLTNTHTPNCLAACQPITTPHLQHRYLSLLPTCVPPCFNLFSATSFFHYNPHLDESTFITFNYSLCQSSASYRARTSDCLAPSPPPWILWQLLPCLQLVHNYHLSFFLFFFSWLFVAIFPEPCWASTPVF